MLRGVALLAVAGAALAANSWSIIAENVATEATGIAAASPQVVYMAGGQNGAGSFVFKSVDGGNTWATTHDAQELLYLDITAFNTTNVLAAATLSDEFSTDGTNFAYSKNGALTAQCARNLGPSAAPLGFAVVGTVGNLANETNGLAVSYDGGATFASIPLPILQTDARYGAFPTATTWYISAGQWPGGSGSSDQPTSGGSSSSSSGGSGFGERALSEKLSISVDPKSKAVRHHWAESKRGNNVVHSGRSLQAPNSTYAMQIVKTTDGGKTWSNQLFQSGFAYANGIDCWDENTCCFAAEADDGPYAGAYMYCTWNGGAQWQQTWNNTQAGASLLDFRVVANGVGWAVGGIINGLPEASGFLLTTDMGKTWTIDSVLQSTYATSVDCVVETTDCWATVLDATQTASVAYSNVA